MRIAVMAAGAVGGYFGARLVAAGNDVVFFARGAHLDAIRQRGLRVESVLGNVEVKNAFATDSTEGVAPVDVVLFAVKLWDTEKAAAMLKPLLGPQSRVITVQNGIDAVEIIARVLGHERVVGGIAQIASVIAAPGVISHGSRFQVLRFGHPGARPDPTLSAFMDAGKAAGLDFALSDNIERDLWSKFVILVGMSGITAATRLPIGATREDPDTRAFLKKIVREVVAVAGAKGAPLPADFADDLAFFDAAPVTMKASMAHDLERGNRLELDWLAGRVAVLGRELGVATPANEAIYAILKPYRMGRTEKS